MISRCSSPSGAIASESIKFTTSRRALSTNARSLPTWQMPNSARCHISWPSDSAIETLNLLRTRALIARSTCRLPFREWFSGRNRVSRITPTTMIRPLLHARRIIPTRPGRPRKLIRVVTASSSLELFFDRGRAAQVLRFRRSKLAQNRFHLKSFDNVVGLHVVEVLERDTAFVALRYFARVVLEALE